MSQCRMLRRCACASPSATWAANSTAYRHGKGPLRMQLVERSAVYELHDQHHQLSAPQLQRVMRRRDVRVGLQRRRGRELDQEPITSVGAPQPLPAQALQRHATDRHSRKTGPGIFGEIHLAHAADTDQPLHAIGTTHIALRERAGFEGLRQVGWRRIAGSRGAHRVPCCGLQHEQHLVPDLRSFRERGLDRGTVGRRLERPAAVQQHLHTSPLLRRHARIDCSRVLRNARAARNSLFTVANDTPLASATSWSDNPVKIRSSSMEAWSGSRRARLSSAS